MNHIEYLFEECSPLEEIENHIFKGCAFLSCFVILENIVHIDPQWLRILHEKPVGKGRSTLTKTNSTQPQSSPVISQNETKKVPHVVIVGGGFGGLAAAKRLG